MKVKPKVIVKKPVRNNAYIHNLYFSSNLLEVSTVANSVSQIKVFDEL